MKIRTFIVFLRKYTSRILTNKGKNIRKLIPRFLIANKFSFSAFMRNAAYTLISFVCIIVLIKLFSFSTDEERNRYERQFRENYHIYSLGIPNKLDFAGERVPLEDFNVKERLDRELLVNTYFHSQTLLHHKRANRWFPIIKPILKEHGIPEDFIYLTLAESGLANVVSPKNAVGFWQILKPTALQYGLEVNNNVDERYHVELATKAACKYLLHSHDVFGNWTIVAASYNMGITGIKRQLIRQKANSYYDLILNSETSRYIFRLLALKEIINDPSRYGFIYRDEDLYQSIDFEEIKIDTAVTNFANFSFQHGINYKMLKIFNPWLRDSHLNNKSRKEYTIKIPKLDFDPLANNEYYLKGFETEMMSHEKDKLNLQELIHIVQPGEDINMIAKEYKIKVQDLMDWNGLTQTFLNENQQLIIFAKLDDEASQLEQTEKIE